MYEGLITYLKDKQATLERTCNHCGHCIDLSELSTTGSSSYSEGLDIDPDFYTDSDHESDGTERDSATASDPYSLVNHLESVSLIPLVGEGKIEDRVNALWDQLVDMMPWLPALYQADTVLIATHSQGTPVSTLLLDRLITQGLVNPQRQRVGMLAMAGISHGPFSYLRDNVVVKYFEAEAARELFTLASPDSPVSVKFRQAMDRALNAGVKVVTVGSMVDQVVPLYSSIVHGLSHMNVYRAIYIDGAHFSGDFLTDLLIFAIKLRNYGLRDHDLVVHISEIIAGSLYTGTPGHSTIYNDAQVYETAARWVMESIPSSHLADPTAASAGFFQKWATFRNVDPAPSTPSSFQDFQLESRNNPYYLPWIMRGLLEDPLILNHPELGPDLAILKQKFLQWNPMQKNLRDLKFRLEPLRASL
ncbi:hypothetical protein BJ085DRAFT_24325 [Dimargaris cristalligena]|uniref:YMC020W-like alpha/beta hydrolase domain-containing protein n=1 Tax=Dimargaris cristalligena TaxID=215637 RepID=A0A4P9ZTL1_9FUNG|nr:hypothetical protein BJ085DRAFT_24325 [Dimargaris cristalligena]|eukprot:RKP36926.1 hypothetical protein BJ085DRAFT_24325 [Dimargaris cristalligena]